MYNNYYPRRTYDQVVDSLFYDNNLDQTNDNRNQMIQQQQQTNQANSDLGFNIPPEVLAILKGLETAVEKIIQKFEDDADSIVSSLKSIKTELGERPDTGLKSVGEFFKQHSKTMVIVGLTGMVCLILIVVLLLIIIARE